MSNLFVSYLSCDDRVLHAFPTRRSSDLRGHDRAAVDERAGRDDHAAGVLREVAGQAVGLVGESLEPRPAGAPRDRKSTRLNSSHGYISYAVFCLKKKIKVKLPDSPTVS